MTPPVDLAAKTARLLAALGEWPGVAVAFSGGVDSSVVAKAARLALGDKAVAVTADSPSVPRAEVAATRRLAASIGIRHVVLETKEFDDPNYLRNDGGRCYFCKSELYAVIDRLLPELGVPVVASGANLDDMGDYRPGLKAAEEHNVRHPLQEAGFTKADVRAIAKEWGLSVWDKPASPCLSSRLAPGLPVTPERIARVEAAEIVLKNFGLTDCRVRYHDGDVARLELPPGDVARFATEPVRSRITAALHGLGFKFVTLDLDGLRSGSLNDLVPLEVKSRFGGAR
jgi:uncharacterized protein